MSRVKSAIWLFDSFEQFWNSRSFLDFTKVASSRIRNLIYCLDRSEELIEKNFQAAEESAEEDKFNTRGNDRNFPLWWTFVMERDDDVYLKSISLFSPHHCGQIRLTEINNFLKESSKWATGNFFSTDILDFYGCTIIFGVWLELSGIPTHILKSIAPNLNFSQSLSLFSLYKNSFLGETFKIHQFFVANYINDFTVNESHMSASIFSDFFCLTIPYGKPFTGLEKIFFPFDFYVWIIFMATFMIAFFVILIIKLFAQFEIAQFIYGEVALSPALNVFAVFMGCGHPVLPKRNFARFLLMSFTLFCLIMR